MDHIADFKDFGDKASQPKYIKMKSFPHLIICLPEYFKVF